MNIFVKIFSKSFCEIWDWKLQFIPVLFFLGRSNFIPCTPLPHPRWPPTWANHLG
jgi:hypothetical protein